MSKIRIFNDPIYGLISFPFSILYDLIDHPYVQRLRRIKQTGFADFVYPGSTHSRFHHALGALHLCVRLIEVLKKKNIDISDEEYEACCIAVLLHDIGHGPYSHALEHMLVELHHEELTLMILNKLNEEYKGRLNLAIQIFKKEYSKKFLSQLLSSQLDVDRMDYLNRDSFYTGVSEGIIGYDRILAMMNVANDELVVEEKGIYSIDKFLISRYLMYLQVYHHKTSIGLELLAKRLIETYKSSILPDRRKPHISLEKLLAPTKPKDGYLKDFLSLDDSDFIFFLKMMSTDSNQELRFLSKAFLSRELFKIKIYKSDEERERSIKKIENKGTTSAIKTVPLMDEICISLYDFQDEIKILTKSKGVVNFSEISLFDLHLKETLYAYGIHQV